MEAFARTGQKIARLIPGRGVSASLMALVALSFAGITWAALSHPLASTEGHWLVADYNGDHKDDVLWQARTADQAHRMEYSGVLAAANHWQEALLGRSDNGDHNKHGEHSEHYRMVSGDFNGDFFADLLLQSRRADGDSYTLLSAQGRFEQVHQRFGGGSKGLGPTTQHLVHSGDFNGDGRADLLQQPLTEEGRPRIYFADTHGRFHDHAAYTISPGSVTPDNPEGWGYDRYHLHVADLDGDGQDDIFLQTQTPDHSSHIMLAGADGTFTGVEQSFDSDHLGLDWSAKNTRLYFGDFNGDQQDDVALVARQGEAATHLVYGFNGQLLSISETQTTGPRRDDHRLLAGDFDGDGVSELVLVNTAGELLAVWFVSEARRQAITIALGHYRYQPPDHSGLPASAGVFRSASVTAPSPPPSSSTGLKGHEAGTATGLLAANSPRAIELTATSDTLHASREPHGEATVGGFFGEARVDAGRAVFEVPIVLPPGRAGLAPSLSFRYSSQQGNGLLGTGWSLSGQSHIGRCFKTIEHDGEREGIQYNRSDRYCMDGVRLRLVSGQHGQNGAIYRKELDDFTRIKAMGSSGAPVSGPAWFEVTMKSGSIHHYGNSDDAREKPVGLSHVRRWHKQKTVDRAGNTIVYRYTPPGPGRVHRLQQIDYTGYRSSSGDRSVMFQYEPRPDDYLRYDEGTASLMTSRLASVKTAVAGRIIREYWLGYKSAPASQVSRVTRIKSCAHKQGQTYCVEPMDFRYTDDAASLLQFSTKLVAEERVSILPYYPSDQFVDLNADGVLDEIGTARGVLGGGNSYSLSITWGHPGGLPAIEFNEEAFADGLLGAYRPNNLSKSYNFEKVFADPGARVSTRTRPVSFLDVDVDGQLDVLLREYDPTQPNRIEVETLGYAHFVGNTFGQPRIDDWTIKPLFDTRGRAIEAMVRHPVLTLDANGDGRTDLLVARQNDNTHNVTKTPYDAVLYLNTADGFVEQSLGQQALLDRSCKAEDFNRDGRTDVVCFHFNQQRVYLSRKQNGQWRFVQTGSVSLGTASPQIMRLDLNGDGLVDSVASNYVESGQRATLHVYLNTGQGQLRALPAQARMGAYGGVKSPGTGGYRILDIDNDGQDELLVATDLVAAAPDFHRADDDGENTCDEIKVTDPEDGRRETYYECGSHIPDDLPNAVLEHDERSYHVFRWSVLELDAANLRLKQRITNIHSSTRMQIKDFNGDGSIDVLAYQAITHMREYDGVASGQPGRVARALYRSPVSNQSGKLQSAEVRRLGASRHFQYQSIYSPGAGHDNGFYALTGEDPATFPLVNYASSQLVVRAMQRSDGLGGQRNTRYRYRDARFHAQGRGFMGFREIHTIEPERGLETRTTYHQHFPLMGRIKTTEVRPMGQARVIASTQYGWHALRLNGGKTRFPYPQTVTENRYDLYTGQHLVQTVTTQCYDRPGQCRGNGDGDGPDYSGYGQWGNARYTSTVIEDKQPGHQFGRYFSASLNTYSVPSVHDGWTGRLDQRQQTRRVQWQGDAGGVGDDHTVQTTTRWQYYTDPARPAYRKVKSETRAQGTALAHTTEYRYNQYGLPITTRLTGGTGEHRLEKARAQTLDYTDDGYFVATTTDRDADRPGDTRFKTTQQTEPGHGNVVQRTDANGIQTRLDYDAFGREIRHQVAQLPAISRVYDWCRGDDQHCPAAARYRITRLEPGQPTRIEYLDALDRVLRIRRQHFGDNQYVHQDTRYDRLGRVLEVSVPYTVGQTAYPAERYAQYDVLDRPRFKWTAADPSGYDGNTRLRMAYDYNGLSTRITVGTGPNAFVVSRISNGQDQLLQTVDANGEPTHYRYDAQGHPNLIQNSAGHRTSARYNVLGHKEEMRDPDRGVWHFRYNVLGELKSRTDARGQQLGLRYDSFGRLQERWENGVLKATWAYDSAAHGLGRLHTESRLGEWHRTFSYDALGRTDAVSVRIEADGSGGDGDQHFTTRNRYDPVTGQLVSMTYPDGHRLYHQYNARGFLTRRRATDSNGAVYERIMAMDSWGNPSQVRYGNGLIAHHRYSPRSGQLLSLCLSPDSSCTVASSNNRQAISYHYDQFGNLKEQYNHIQGVREVLDYHEAHSDNLLRLRQSTRTVDLGYDRVYQQQVTYDYDAIGNLVHKSDWGARYRNGEAAGTDSATGALYRPHQVGQVLDASGQVKARYHYDRNGNLVEGHNRRTTYNLDNKPVQIAGDGRSSRFDYDATGQRYRQQAVSADETVTTLYLGEGFEWIRTQSDGDTRVQSRITVGGVVLNYHEQTDCRSVHYRHRDRLGSTTALSNHQGTVVERYGYDAFGKVRTANWQSDRVVPGDLSRAVGLHSRLTTRGFTDHEHLDNVGLIHMNGRAYDPALGRFMSVDPFIALPEDSQSLNPYSYVQNNPLSGTDPSGYFSMHFMPSFWGISTGLSDFGGTGPQGLWGWDSAQRGGSAQERIENFAESTHNDSEGVETIVVTGHRQEVLLEQLLEIKQWYDELEKQHPVAATVVDVTPIIGDIMGIAEAIQDPSLLNIGIAAAGIVPGLGDAIATATKGAKKLFGRGAEGAKGGDDTVDVYRAFGGDARAQGFSWTTKDPRKVDNFRDAAGLPSGGESGATNTADFLIEGRVKASDIIESRSALPLDGNKGGLPELIIDPKNVKLTDFSVLKP